jgi:hypothetical protein
MSIQEIRAEVQALPADERALADKQSALLKENAGHPSLRLKKVGRYRSVRIGGVCVRWQWKAARIWCGSGSVNIRSLHASSGGANQTAQPL